MDSLYFIVPLSWIVITFVMMVGCSLWSFSIDKATKRGFESGVALGMRSVRSEFESQVMYMCEPCGAPNLIVFCEGGVYLSDLDGSFCRFIED